MKYLIFKDKKKRIAYARLEKKYLIMKLIQKSLFIFNDLKYFSNGKLEKCMQYGSFTKVKNRCIISNRSKSVYRKFGISRIKFRELASYGVLFGVRKSSW
jgi:small subunit ribosomal protein S14